MKKILIKLKTTSLWKSFLLFFLIPSYKVLWEYIINFEGKILFLRKIKNLQCFRDIKTENNDKFIIKNNSKFSEISSIINKNLDENFLNKMRQKILELKKPENHYLHNKPSYKINMFPFLEKEIQDKIVEFALNEENIAFVSKYLKVAPIISSIYVNLNVPVKNTVERGPMLWHKDDFGFKSLDIFLPLKKMSEDSGPLYYYEMKNNLGVFHKYLGSIKSAKKGERNKININSFENVNEQNISKFIGDVGDALFIDSFSCYHRGGFCKSEERLMMRITYQTPDSISLSNNDSLRGLNQEIIQKYKNKNSKLINYSLFKRNIFFNKISLQKILLKFYKLVHYKDTSLIKNS